MLRKLRLRPKPREDGPVFISYRRSDGASYVDLIETFLWAGGIAPWRDIIDLPAARRICGSGKHSGKAYRRQSWSSLQKSVTASSSRE